MQNYAFYIIIIIHLVRNKYYNYVIITHLVIISKNIYIKRKFMIKLVQHMGLSLVNK